MPSKAKRAAAPQPPRNEEEARPVFGLSRFLSGVLGDDTMREMADECAVVRFQGNEYLLIGDMERGGPLATREQYTTGACSYAHLFPDGRILRFSKQIGSRADLVLVKGDARVSPPSKTESP